ncbi:MAG: DUF4785 family protein [Ahniella sp.]|nr:DUF4785 family protein [Ahniella sp.]
MNTIRPLVLTLALVLAGTAEARELRLAAPAAGDLSPTQLVSSPASAEKASRLEAAPVQFSWVLPADQTLSAPLPHRADSREFWTRVSAQELSAGKTLTTSAKGALIRLSPIGQAKGAADPLQVEITAGGQTFARGDGLKNSANEAELKAAGTSFPSGTLAFQLKDEVGQGDITLRLPKAANDYLVHVFEPNSAEVLSLQTDRITAVHGGEFKVLARFNAGDTAQAIGGFLSSPTGEQVELSFEREGDDYVAKVRHDGLIGEGEGLWEIHTFASANGIQRDAKTAIVSSVPRARFAGTADHAKTRNGSLRLRVDVSVAAASRFEVRGILFGRDGKAVRAGAMASSAAILKPGQQSLDLVFDAETLAKSGLSAPYSVRDLTLVDQGSLAVQESRAAGIEL